MSSQTRQGRALMRQCLPHGAWSGGVRCFPPDRLSQAAQSPPESQVQRQPCSTAKQSRSCTATPSDEQLLAELEDFDQQCLQAYITSSRSTDQAPHFEDEAEFNLFQQEAAARCKLDAARREAEALLEADAEQDSVLQAAAQSALAEREACCQQLHFAAELMSKPHKFSEMAMEDLSNLQAAAQHFLSVCNDVRDLLHEEELIKVQREKQKIAEALHAAEALAENHTGQFVKLRQEKMKLEERLEAEADRHKCCICMTKQRDALVLPCMHMDYCVTCINKHMQTSATCPVCRVPIRGIIPTLLAQ